LPHVTLPGHLRSGFQIRRQPKEHCLSTIEAVAHALSALEPATRAVERLLPAFVRMQEQQLVLPRNSGRSRRRRRPRPSRAIPRALVEHYPRLVVVYAESVVAQGSGKARTLLSCAAARPATGERFQQLVCRPDLPPERLAALGYTRTQLEGGLDEAQLRARFRQFFRPGDVLASWTKATLELLRSIGVSTERSVLLKAAYYNLGRGRGSLDEVALAEGLASESDQSLSGTGACRADRRLDNALALSRLLHELACSEGPSPAGRAAEPTASQ
jgi:hypothetical protein